MAARRNTKIKVAHVLDHVGLGGIQTQLYRVLSHLDRDRFEVHLHTPRGARAMKEDFEALDLTFYHYSKSFFGLPWIMAEFARHVREEKYDIMHYHMAASRVFGYLSLRSKPDSTHIVAHHHSHLSRLPTYYGIVPKFDSMADMLLACSSAVADEVRSAYDVGDSRIRTIYNCVDIDSFDEQKTGTTPLSERAPKDVPLVGWTGRLTEVKGVDVLLEAWAGVVNRTEAHLLLVGSGKLEDELRRRAGELSIGETVTFGGYRPSSEIPAILAMCDLYVQPSRREGIPLSMLEAMAAELAVVATDIPGPAEVMDHSDAGLLVPPENSTALAGALVELLGDQQRRRQMGQNARKRVVHQFSVKRITAQIEDMYTQLMDER